jgi:hypothetical protein
MNTHYYITKPHFHDDVSPIDMSPNEVPWILCSMSDMSHGQYVPEQYVPTLTLNRGDGTIANLYLQCRCVLYSLRSLLIVSPGYI